MKHRPWKKVWHEKLLSSTRFRRLRPYDRGIYFTLLLLADSAGKVVSGSRPLFADDLAFELGRERSKKAVRDSIERLLADDCGLLSQETPEAPLVVVGFEELAG